MDKNHGTGPLPDKTASLPARYLNSVELGEVVQLLLELRRTTLSRRVYDTATRLIRSFGGGQCLGD